MTASLYGLVLSGGRSLRMGIDKGSIVYHGIDQRSHCMRLLENFCEEVFVSIRQEQHSLLSPGQNALFDSNFDIGPAAGLLAAHEKKPEGAWLVLACDMPQITRAEIEFLVERRQPRKAATYYETSQIEPLFAIWEPEALKHLKLEIQLGKTSPRRCLEILNCESVEGDFAKLSSQNSPSNS